MKLAIVLFGVVAASSAYADTPSLPGLSDYPQTVKDASRWTVAEGHDGPKVNILAMTAFFGGLHSADFYSVNEKGVENDFRGLLGPTGDVQADHSEQLSPAQMADLQSAISELPHQNSHPPAGNLLLVGFRNGAAWRVLSLDNRALPPAMRKIYDIIGERFETVQQRTGHP